jgi:hypothetical protein
MISAHQHDHLRIHRVLHAILSERIILNIRSAVNSKAQMSGVQPHSGSSGSYTLRELRFAGPLSTVASSFPEAGLSRDVGGEATTSSE